MEENILALIETGSMIGGKLTFQDGFAIFKRLPIEELKQFSEDERAYATTAMGRAVFQLGTDGKIINYKGVDSHLDNREMGLIDKVGAIPINITKNNENYTESSYPLNLVLFLDKDGKPRADIRIRGASPLEDLEIEADINSRMQTAGIKLPKIDRVGEFSQEFLENFGLPTYVNGDFSEFDSDYEQEDIARKSYLKAIMGDKYKEQVIQGKRPERVSEYLKKLEVVSNPEVEAFLKVHNCTIKAFSDYVDKEYSRGQRYGQAIREVDSPFRIADFELLLGDEKNLPKIEAMVKFTEKYHPDRVPFENYFAKQLGKNLGNMMNNGWECENFSHRQDYSITGEMCDDSYVYAPKELDKLDELEYLGKQKLQTATSQKEIDKANDQIGMSKAGKTKLRLKYVAQIYSLGSNIKILQEEMKMRGKSKEEIDSVLTDFLDSFHQTLDIEKASVKITDRPDTIKKALEILVRTPKNMAKLLAFEPSGPGKSDISEETLKTQSPYNAFFDEISMGLADRFDIDRTFINLTPKDVKGVRPYEDFGDEGLR